MSLPAIRPSIHPAPQPANALGASPAPAAELIGIEPSARARAAIGVSAAKPNGDEARIEKLLASMTLEEKALQMSMTAGGGLVTGPNPTANAAMDQNAAKLGSILNPGTSERIENLVRQGDQAGVPPLIFADNITSDITQYPQPLTLACSFDRELAFQVGRDVAVESRARGIHGTFSPNLDLHADSRDGRRVEGFGNATALTTKLGGALISGFHAGGLVTCPKHIAGYGAPATGVDYGANTMSKLELMTHVLPPFERAVTEGSMSIMPGFNAILGQPATASKWLLRDVMRDRWGAKDMVVISDYTAVMELIHHGVTQGRTPEECEQSAVIASLQATVDIDMVSGLYAKWIPTLVREGRVPQKAIDNAVRRILELKLQRGVLDNPYGDPKAEKETVLSPAHLKDAVTAAERSIVLLKNDAVAGKPLLPLGDDVDDIAVIGPLADSKIDQLGQWHGNSKADDSVTLFEALRARGPAIHYAPGCKHNAPGTAKMRADAIAAAKQSDVAVLVVGDTKEMSGEASTRFHPTVPQAYVDLAKELVAEGANVVVVSQDGRPLTGYGWLTDNCPAFVRAGQLGTMAGEAIANILFGKNQAGDVVNPSGRLAFDMVDDIGSEAPAQHNRYPSGRPPVRTDAQGNNIADRWYVHGEARFTPDGEKDISEIKRVDSGLLFPFGAGLSYTTFEQSAARILKNSHRAGESAETNQISLRAARQEGVTVAVDVTNSGDARGIETVMLFSRDLQASVVQPEKKLVDFQQVELDPGETRTVELHVSPDDLAVIDPETLNRTIEPGEFKLWIGKSSRDSDCTTTVLDVVESDPLAAQLRARRAYVEGWGDLAD